MIQKKAMALVLEVVNMFIIWGGAIQIQRSKSAPFVSINQQLQNIVSRTPPLGLYCMKRGFIWSCMYNNVSCLVRGPSMRIAPGFAGALLSLHSLETPGLPNKRSPSPSQRDPGRVPGTTLGMKCFDFSYITVMLQYSCPRSGIPLFSTFPFKTDHGSGCLGTPARESLILHHRNHTRV